MKRVFPFLLAGLLCLPACGREAEITEVVVTEEPAAGEPAESTPAEKPAAEKPAAGKTDMGKWVGYDEHLPFILGAEKGLAEAKSQGKPAFFFYGATW